MAHERVNKLDDLYIGPYKIIGKQGNVFKIQNANNNKDTKTAHIQQLKKHYSSDNDNYDSNILSLIFNN
jgi:hypothetical protein